MEYFHYVNIFETKGLEYILVIIFMITFVFFVRNLDASRKPNNSAASSRKNPILSDTIVVVDNSTESDRPAES